ncbi:MAG: PhzF family phenazine biosynthesis isomerase [Candidatus Thiodiazotropha sp. 6PLUC9]
MNRSVYIVDAFTCHPFQGNPAAVCILEQPADSAWMQSVATEINLSDTAFLLLREDGGWDLRWFTPKVEVTLCGHATLASAHILWHELGMESESLHFHSASGLLIATRQENRILLDFPIDHLSELNSDPLLVKAIGEKPQTIFRGREDLLVVFQTADQVRALTPDQAGLSKVDCRGVIATAPGDQSGIDFISRFFAPALGIPEDPVTGSAHCTLAPYWGERLDKSELQAYQASARGGDIGIRLNGNRVTILGQAVTTMAGALYV